MVERILEPRRAPSATLSHLWELPFYPARDAAVWNAERKEAKVRSALHVSRSVALVERTKAALRLSRQLLESNPHLVHGEELTKPGNKK